jgi:hypothetical protein
MLITPLLDEVEPITAPVAKPSKSESNGGPKMDARDLSRRAIKHFAFVKDCLVDRSGMPHECVRALSPNYVPYDPNKGRPFGVPYSGPQLKEFRGPNPWEVDKTLGSWVDVGTGAHGRDVVDLVAYLGSCDRSTAGAYLSSVLARVVEVAA